MLFLAHDLRYLCFNCLTFLIYRRKDLHKYANRFPKKSMKIGTWGTTGNHVSYINQKI